MSDWLRDFPSLTTEEYRVTSPATRDYNCIAWAAARTDTWWEPSPDGYWPPGVPMEYTLEAYSMAYSAFGYSRCWDGNFEILFEKIAIYADVTNEPTHAARQLDNGRWTSKLGSDIDIEHTSPEALTGPLYGRPFVYMRRRRTITRIIAALPTWIAGWLNAVMRRRS